MPDAQSHDPAAGSGRHASLPRMRAVMRAATVRAPILATLWWVLAGSGASWVVGAPTVALALWSSLKLVPPGSVRFSPIGALGFLGFFLRQSLRGGVQVALMALRPRLDLHPAQLDLELRLPPGPSQLFLASALSLMPGTLAVNVENNRLLLHVLDSRRPVERDARAAEMRVARMYRQELR